MQEPVCRRHRPRWTPIVLASRPATIQSHNLEHLDPFYPIVLINNIRSLLRFLFSLSYPHRLPATLLCFGFGQFRDPGRLAHARPYATTHRTQCSAYAAGYQFYFSCRLPAHTRLVRMLIFGLGYAHTLPQSTSSSLSPPHTSSTGHAYTARCFSSSS